VLSFPPEKREARRIPIDERERGDAICVFSDYCATGFWQDSESNVKNIEKRWTRTLSKRIYLGFGKG